MSPWRTDAEGAPPQTRPSEAAALALQAELMAKGGVRYVVVWWQGPPGLRKGPRACAGAAQDARGVRSGTPGTPGCSHPLLERSNEERGMTMTTCPRCPAEWTGMSIQHCASCHETFTGTRPGDMHRTGRHDTSTGPKRRRCLTVEEMTKKGMTRNASGYWTTGRASPQWWKRGDVA